MKIFKLYILLTVLGLVACLLGCSSNQKKTTTDKAEEATPPLASTSLAEDTAVWYEGETPFLFDYKKNYPETAIRLSDLADVSYLPLETRDTVLLRLRGTCYGNEYFITQEAIYMQEEQSELYIFGKDGRFIRKISKRGGGPGEYSYITSFAVDTLQRVIFVQDENRKRGHTNVYDLQGNFLRQFSIRANEIVILNDSLLLTYNRRANKQYPFAVVRKADGSEVRKLPIRFYEDFPVDVEYLAYGNLVTTPKGALIGNLANDTIFEVRKDLSIRPRIVDQSNYGTPYAQVHPTIETSRYLMFYILCARNYKVSVKEHFYIYDKKEGKIFRMKDYTDNSYWRLMDDYPHLINWEKAQNPTVAVRSRVVDALQEANGKHGSPELRRLIETLKDDDNPVLEIMQFHSVDNIE